MMKGSLLNIVVGFKYIARNTAINVGYEICYGDSSTNEIFKLEIS